MIDWFNIYSNGIHIYESLNEIISQLSIKKIKVDILQSLNLLKKSTKEYFYNRHIQIKK